MRMILERYLVCQISSTCTNIFFVHVYNFVRKITCTPIHLYIAKLMIFNNFNDFLVGLLKRCISMILVSVKFQRCPDRVYMGRSKKNHMCIVLTLSGVYEVAYAQLFRQKTCKKQKCVYNHFDIKYKIRCIHLQFESNVHTNFLF